MAKGKKSKSRPADSPAPPRQTAPTAAQSAAPQRPPRFWLGAALAAALAINALAVVVWLAFHLPVHGDTLFPETAVVARALDAAHGRPVYQDWREWPHAFAPYGPLTYYPVGWIARLGGGSPGAVRLLGRLLAFGSLLGCAAMIAMILRRFEVPLAWSSCGGAALLLWHPPLVFGGTFRPDMPQVFLSLAALWIALGKQATPPRVAAALLSLSAAFWFKAASIGPALAIAAWLFLALPRRRFAVAAIGFVLGNLALAFALDAATSGALFLNLFGSLDNGWSSANLVGFYMSFGFSSSDKLRFAAFALAGAAALAGAVASAARPPAGTPERLLAIAALASFGASHLVILKIGSWVNYFFEAYGLLAAIAALWAWRAWSAAASISPKLRTAILWGALAPCVVLLSLAGLPKLASGIGDLRKKQAPTDLELQMRNVEAPILSPQMGSLLMERPAPPALIDFAQYGLLLRRGKISDAPLIDRIARREFGGIILPAPGSPAAEEYLARLLPPRFLPEIGRQYREAGRIGDFLLYVHKE